MGRGSTDKRTLILQDYLRKLLQQDIDQYQLVVQYLTEHGYIIHRNAHDVLMLRKPKDITGLDTLTIATLLKKGINHDRA